MAVMLNLTPLRRRGLPSAIASVAGFLCSAADSYVTGCDIIIDGGTLAALKRYFIEMPTIQASFTAPHPEERNMLEGYHYQNAYVTRDIEQGIAKLQQFSKVDRVIQFEATTDVTTPTGRGTQTSKLAFIWIGDLQYELIQPLGGDVSLYSDALPTGDGLQFHHICMRIPEWDEFRQRVAAQPFPVVLEGGSDALRFLYLDTRPLLGHYVEYCWMNEERWRQLGGQ